MKRFILINTALVALAMLVSCQKGQFAEKEITATGVTEFTASIAQTKTAIDNAGKVTWVAGDEITVTDAASNSAVYVAQYSGVSTKFTLKDDETAVGDGPYTADYGNLSSQVYDAAGANCPLTAPATSTTNFTFSSPYAVVKVTAKSSNSEVIKSVEVNYGEKKSTLDCGDGVTLTSEGQVFYIAVAPATDALISVTFYTDDKMVKRYRNAAVTLAAKDLLPVEFNFTEGMWEDISVTGVSIEPISVTLPVGDTFRLKAAITPENATNKNVTWSSSDDTKVIVNDTGTLTAIAFGEATITVTTVDGSKTATCEVKVTETKTMSELLATNTDIPVVEDMTPPAKAWVNSADSACKAFVGVDGYGEKLFVFEKITEVDTTYFGLCMDDVFVKIDGTTYKYVDAAATVTVKMTGGEFTSCECEFNITITALQVLNGTYAPVVLPAGALPGVFSVGATKKVHFSQGNLYWDGDSYEFEENQYTFGTWNAENHVNYFFWSKEESVAKAASYSDASAAASDVFFTNATAETAKADFTVSGVTGEFRTLSAEEWTYILSTRANAADLLVEDVTVCDVEHCLVIAPDACLNSYVFDKTKKSYDAAAWATAEAAGLVCLPPAGYRDGTEVKSGDGNGFYWASTTDAADKASNLGFKKSDN